VIGVSTQCVFCAVGLNCYILFTCRVEAYLKTELEEKSESIYLGGGGQEERNLLVNSQASPALRSGKGCTFSLSYYPYQKDEQRSVGIF
jgi:hypothetical protein